MHERLELPEMPANRSNSNLLQARQDKHEEIAPWSGAIAIRALAIGLITLVLLLKGAILLLRGEVYGRLAIPPVYDDVTYFVDAMERVVVFKSAGLSAFVKGLVADPPHSPYALLGGFAGFLLTHGSTVAPYAFNALSAALLTALLLIVFEVRALVAVVGTIAVAATAWFDHTVTVYHPDLIAGYGTGVVAAIAVFQRELLRGRLKTFVAGILGGCVLLIKPTAFPAVLVVWSVAFAFGCIACLVDRQAVSAVARRFVIVLVCVAVVAGPYFAVHLVEIVRYIYQAFARDVDAWNKLYHPNNSQIDAVTFYLRQCLDLFGPIPVLACALWVIACTAAVRGQQSARVLELFGVLAVVAVAYIVPTLAPVKLMLFGGPFYGAIIVSFLVLLHLVWSELRPVLLTDRRFRWAQGPAIGLIFLAAVFAFCEDSQTRFGSWLHDGPIDYDRIYAAVIQSAKLEGATAEHSFSLFLPSPGPVPPSAFRFRGLKDGVDLPVTTAPLENRLEPLEAMAHEAKLTLIPDPALLETMPKYPVHQALGELVQRMRADNSFREQAPLELPAGSMLLFVNIR